MLACESPRGGTIYNPERRVAVQAGCGRWGCRSCGGRKAKRVADKFARLGATHLITLTVLPGRGWPTLENYKLLQNSWRWFSRWLQRHRLVAAYGWVTEVSDVRPACTCPPPPETHRGPQGPQGSLFGRDCTCGVGGNRLHRHLLLKVTTPPNRFGVRWLPYAAMQAAAKRCGLGVADFKPIFNGPGAARYVSKYLGKDLTVRRPWVRRYAMNVRIPDAPKEAGWVFSTFRVAFVAREYLGAPEGLDWDATFWSAAAP